jgi:hypothetical protein
MSLENTEDITAHLHRELVEYALLKFSFVEIWNGCQICRHFRDVDNGVLNRQFLNHRNCVGSQLAAVTKEGTRHLGKLLNSGTGSTEGAKHVSASQGS